MLLHTLCYGWVSNKMAGEYPVLQGAGWALRNTMQTLVVIGNNLSGLVSVGINESILASDHWHQQKKFILILVFPAQHISSWNEMAPTTVPGAKSLKSYFFPALILALNFGKSSYLHGKMLWCCPVVTSTWSAQDEVAREHYMLQTWMHHVTYSSWKDAHTERCSSGQPAHDRI